MKSKQFKPSNTHRKILLVLPTTEEGAITTNAVAKAAGLPQGSTGGRLAELAREGYAGKIPGTKGPGGATRWWRMSRAGFAALDMLLILGVLGALIGMAMLARAPGLAGGAWAGAAIGSLVLLVSSGVAGFAIRRLPAPTQNPVKQLGGALPLALSQADAERDRADGVADHAIYVAPHALLMETARQAPSLAERRQRQRRDQNPLGVPQSPLFSGGARKVPVNRGSVRGDLLIAVAVICALALCGCEPEPVGGPKDIEGVDIDSPLAVTRCELLARKIEGANDKIIVARATGIAQTCYLQLIEHRLRRLVPIEEGPPPPAPAAVRKTPLSDGGGPDVGRIPPQARPLVGPNGERNQP